MLAGVLGATAPPLVGITSSAFGSSGGQSLVDLATSQAGVTYCWDGGDQNGPSHGSGNGGGEAHDCGAPSTVGFDCTGLVLWAVYHATGGAIILPHDSTQMSAAAQVGTVISSQSSLQVGDLVYFHDQGSSAMSHVGIYAGTDSSGYQVMWDANTMWWIYGDGVQERRLDATESGSTGLVFMGAVRLSLGGGVGGGGSQQRRSTAYGPADFNHDGVSDYAIDSGGQWAAKSGATGAYIAQGLALGDSNCTPMVGDINGDGFSDYVVDCSGQWAAKSGATGAYIAQGLALGDSNCTPMVGDLNKDGAADVAVDCAGQWAARNVAGPYIAQGFSLGDASCRPFIGDYNGDGYGDFAVDCAGQWAAKTTSGSYIAQGVSLGSTSDLGLSGMPTT
ncbi:MAG: NlpC/P60 family protein [Actinomycetota bacterium]|nr:NlpC/P60 family protein [Actinomycetota bacterium]